MCGDPVDPAGFGRRKRATRSNNGTEVQFDNRVAIEIQIPHGTSYFVNEFIKIYKNKG